MRVGFANGCFDLFHDGHRHFLIECRKHCDYLIVAVNSDASVARLKGEGRPFDDLRTRMLHVRGIAEAVVPFDGSPVPLIGQIIPDVILRGGDQSDEGGTLCRVVRIPRLEGFSTTLEAAKLAPGRPKG